MPAQFVSRLLASTIRLDCALRSVTGMKFYVALGLVCFGLWTADNYRSGKLVAAPQVNGDEIHYSCIAVQIWKNHQFAGDYEDNDFLAVYGARDNSRPRNSSPAASFSQLKDTTTYWPPLLPTILGGSYAAFGRNFIAIRL